MSNKLGDMRSRGFNRNNKPVADLTFVKKLKAYKKLFSGKGSKKDAEIVLKDLEDFVNIDKSSYQIGLTMEEIASRAIIKKPILRIKDHLKYSDKNISDLINKLNK